MGKKYKQTTCEKDVKITLKVIENDCFIHYKRNVNCGSLRIKVCNRNIHWKQMSACKTGEIWIRSVI